MYDNFLGSTLNSALWNSAGSGVGISNGLNIPASSSGTSYITSTSLFSSFNNVFEIFWNAVNPSSNYLDFGFNGNSAPTVSALYWKGQGGAETPITANAIGSNSIKAGGVGNTGYYIYSLYTNTTNSIALTATVGNELTATTSYKTPGNIFVGSATVGLQNNGGGSTGKALTVTWVRIRGAPPDGIMPTATYGNVVQIT